MEFTHRTYVPGDTVAALCTPPGEGGVAMVRVTGERAFSLVQKLVGLDVADLPTHTIHYSSLRTVEGEHVDEVLLLIMRAPRSYTGENTVEICCHGGAIVSRRVLEAVLDAGARAAQPGEFTFKAFMNGKMDLAQAEAVQELIHAKNEHALHSADQQLRGALSKTIASYQTRLTKIAAILEAWVDFPEEGLEFTTAEEMSDSLRAVRQEMWELVETFHDGRIVREGVSICIVGSPNVGKSSLLNALVDREKAIVSDAAGTTRDLVEDHLRLNGLNLKLIDTAGLRESEEPIELEGMRRSRVAMQEADIILVVLDASRPLNGFESQLLGEMPEKKTLVAWNKWDLPECKQSPLTFTSITVSAKKKRGLKELREAIDRVIWDGGPPARDQVMLTSQRHREALKRAIEACDALLLGLGDSLSPELLTMEVREGLRQLGYILGSDIGEDILSEIFSTFCVGK